MTPLFFFPKMYLGTPSKGNGSPLTRWAHRLPVYLPGAVHKIYKAKEVLSKSNNGLMLTSEIGTEPN